MGQVEFKDFLWEALLDPAAKVTMGDTAENLARQYQITRKEVDAFAARSFDRALAAQKDGFLDGEIVPVTTETFELPGYESARHQAVAQDARGEGRHPCAALPGRCAGENPAGLRRRADRRQFLGHRRWRRGGSGRELELPEEERQDAARPHRCVRGGRRAAGSDGDRAGAGDQGGARARRA